MNNQVPWLRTLKQVAEKKHLVILRFEDDEWERLRESRRGVSGFTVARAHSLCDGVRVPTLCLIRGGRLCSDSLYLGVLWSCSPVTTLDSRIKVKRVLPIHPRSESGLLDLVSNRAHVRNLRERLHSREPVVVLSPRLSSDLIDGLTRIEENHNALSAAAQLLGTPGVSEDIFALQEDALHMALKAFGLSAHDPAVELRVAHGRETALGRVEIMEDSVIEHDARYIPGYDLVQSDLTGRAVFQRGDQWLEVYTANRRPLEEVFGVDLIYLNATRQNIVMLQYKMLERLDSDWIYRPDAELDKELSRMRKFTAGRPPGLHEYRLNAGIFYLKFVKRDGRIKDGGIIIPIDHFERILTDPACRGPRGGLRVSYESLSGRYLRQDAFLDLIRSGYIGAYAATTADLTTLIKAVLERGRAVVAAIQRCIGTASSPGTYRRLAEELPFSMDVRQTDACATGDTGDCPVQDVARKDHQARTRAQRDNEHIQKLRDNRIRGVNLAELR